MLTKLNQILNSELLAQPLSLKSFSFYILKKKKNTSTSVQQNPILSTYHETLTTVHRSIMANGAEYLSVWLDRGWFELESLLDPLPSLKMLEDSG